MRSVELESCLEYLDEAMQEGRGRRLTKAGDSDGGEGTTYALPSQRSAVWSTPLTHSSTSAIPKGLSMVRIGPLSFA
jgi:hypothetical protein